MSVPRARLLDLLKARCEIFATTYNPDNLRLGNKVLRQRLRGPALASYYPERFPTLRQFNREFAPFLETYDEQELDRLEHIEELKARGKGAPKKKKSAAESKANKRR